METQISDLYGNQGKRKQSFGDMVGVFKRMGRCHGGGHNQRVGEDGKSEV